MLLTLSPLITDISKDEKKLIFSLGSDSRFLNELHDSVTGKKTEEKLLASHLWNSESWVIQFQNEYLTQNCMPCPQRPIGIGKYSTVLDIHHINLELISYRISCSQRPQRSHCF